MWAFLMPIYDAYNLIRNYLLIVLRTFVIDCPRYNLQEKSFCKR